MCIFYRYFFAFVLVSAFSGCSFFSEYSNVKKIPKKVYNSVVSQANSLTEEVSGVVTDTEKNDSLLKKIVEQEQKNFREKTVELKLKTVVETPQKIIVAVVVKNPQRKRIQSLQAWFLYPKSILKGEKIIIKSSDIFPLIAPHERNFDEKNGIVKLGVSSDGKLKKMDSEMVLAEVEFSKISSSPFQLKFFTGHTKAMIITKNGLRNILKENE